MVAWAMLSENQPAESSAINSGVARFGPAHLVGGDIVRVRNVSRSGEYNDNLVVRPGDRLRIAAHIESLRPQVIRELAVSLQIVHRPQRARIDLRVLDRVAGEWWPSDGANIALAVPKTQVCWARRTPMMRDKDGAALASPTGSPPRLQIGDLPAGDTRRVLVDAYVSTPQRGCGSSQIEGGDIVRAVSSARSQDYADPISAEIGDVVTVRMRVHVANPRIPVKVRAAATGASSSGWSGRFEAYSPGAQPTSTADTVTVRLPPGARLRETRRRPQLLRAFGHSKACRRPARSVIRRGSPRAGLPIGLVGYRDLRSECTEVTAFVDLFYVVTRR